MINVSQKYKEYIKTKDRKFTARATITTVDMEVLHITSADIMIGGIKIEDSTSQPSNFEIGSAVMNKLTIQIDNIDERFSIYNFTRAEVTLEIGFLFPDETIEWLKKVSFM